MEATVADPDWTDHLRALTGEGTSACRGAPGIVAAPEANRRTVAVSTTASPLDAPGVDVALRDGSTVRMRSARADDYDAVRSFLEGLSDESRWLRFFGAGPNLDDAAAVAVKRPALGVRWSRVTGADSQVVGHGIYVRDADGEAEVAFAVADAWQGNGMATILLRAWPTPPRPRGSTPSPPRSCRETTG